MNSKAGQVWLAQTLTCITSFSAGQSSPHAAAIPRLKHVVSLRRGICTSTFGVKAAADLLLPPGVATAVEFRHHM